MTQRVLLVDGMALLFRHFMLQVYTINLCIILKVCQPMGFKVLLDISLRQLRILNQAMLRYVGIWGKRP